MIRPAFLAAALLLPLPSVATPLIVAPAEPMVTVQGLERLGPSRLSTVAHCLAVADAEMELLTDDQYETVEACLIEHT